MLTGQVPFVGESTKEVLLSQLIREPTPPRDLRPEIPRSVEKVILRALQKERDQRPQTMIHLAYGLCDALAKRTAESSGALSAVDPGGEQQEVAGDLVVAPTTEEAPDSTMEVLGVAASPLKRYLPFIGLGAGLALGIVVTVLLMSRDDKAPEPRTKVVKEVVVIHAEAGPTPRVHQDPGAPAKKRPAKAHRAHRRHLRRSRPRRHARRTAHKPAPVKTPPSTGKWLATVTSRPAGAEVLDGNRRLGTTPMRVPSDSARVLTLERLGYEPAKVRIPRHSTSTHSTRLKKSTMSWEVLSLSQLKQMMVKGQISRFTYKRRKAQLMKIRDDKIMRLRVKHKMGHLTKEQYERAVQAVKDSYR
jgi:hypothetical protein